jgi:hypothetical protein
MLSIYFRYEESKNWIDANGFVSSKNGLVFFGLILFVSQKETTL